jgi:hypothetical protein
MYSYTLDKLWMYMHVKWLYFMKMLSLIIFCEMNPIHVLFVLKWLHLA